MEIILLLFFAKVLSQTKIYDFNNLKIILQWFYLIC